MPRAAASAGRVTTISGSIVGWTGRGASRAREHLSCDFPTNSAGVVGFVLLDLAVGFRSVEHVRVRPERVLFGPPGNDHANGRDARRNGRAAELTDEHHKSRFAARTRDVTAGLGSRPGGPDGTRTAHRRTGHVTRTHFVCGVIARVCCVEVATRRSAEVSTTGRADVPIGQKLG